MMKVAVIGAKGIPPKQGGIEHCCAEVYSRMAAQGHSIDFFGRSSYTNRSIFEPYVYEGVRVFSLPCPGIRGVDAFASSLMGAMASLGNQYDIVHFHALGPSLFSWVPHLTGSAKVVATCQGLDWQRGKWGKASSQLIRWGEQAAVNFADSLIVVSEHLRSYFLETYGRQSIYIPNAPATYVASDPNFAFGNSLGLTQGRYIVFLGRLVPEKCPDLLIQAFQSLQAQEWKLVFVGGNSDTSGYISELNRLAAGNPNITFAGELQGSRLAEVVRGAGLFALPSNLEGLPLAMLEAMQEGVPVIASDIPPHQQLLGNNRGVLFESGNVESCAKHLEWAMQNPQVMAEMAGTAQRHVKSNFSWDKIAADHLSVYEMLLGAPKGVVKRGKLAVAKSQY